MPAVDGTPVYHPGRAWRARRARSARSRARIGGRSARHDAASYGGGHRLVQQTVFREQALERLSSPEQLDQVMQVTPLRGWLALLALAGLLAAAVMWGVFGSIPIEVNAQGLLLSQQGIRRLVAPSDGGVTAHLRGGDVAHKGDAVVRLRDANGQEVDVASEQDGIVVETYVHTGYPVQAGSPVANIEPSAGGLEAVLMVPATDAKNIQPGMQ